MEKSFEEKIKLLLNSKSNTENKAIIIEELSELQKEVTKDIRKKFNRDNFLEEMAELLLFYIWQKKFIIFLKVN